MLQSPSSTTWTSKRAYSVPPQLAVMAKCAPFWRHYCEANELPYLPKYAEYGRVTNVRRNINKMATRPSQHQQEVRLRLIFIAFANLGPLQDITQRAIRRSRLPHVGHKSPSVG
ncbi:hypothetical protein FDENT_8770 [Fusarium denticulatum]|uniref:Uncharacterized protein n=1 Tax=Fusarium denticulatum TaxID=48507 RepID=A0A8H5U101_9HYPO|nr:hypothetical protein FDENT_8770 [Fusarium denticulatum]